MSEEKRSHARQVKRIETWTDDVEQWFIKNVSEVIKRNRIDCHMSQEDLGAAIGKSGAQINRYESGVSETPIGALAQISIECGFPLREYVELRKNFETHSLDEVFRALVMVGYGKIPRKRASKWPPTPPLRLTSDGSRYEIDREKYDMILRTGINMYSEENQSRIHPDIEMFKDYLETKASPHKKYMLNETYEELLGCGNNVKGTFKHLARGTVSYVASDDDPKLNKKLKQYLQDCRDMLWGK